MSNTATAAAEVNTESQHVCECIECRTNFMHDHPVDLCDTCYATTPGEMTPEEWEEHNAAMAKQQDERYFGVTADALL